MNETTTKTTMTTNTNLKTDPDAPQGLGTPTGGLTLDEVLKELTRCKLKYGGKIKVCMDFGGSDVTGIDETFATLEGIKNHFNPALEPFIDLKDRP
jgi:hypothetical protein